MPCCLEPSLQVPPFPGSEPRKTMARLPIGPRCLYQMYHSNPPALRCVPRQCDLRSRAWPFLLHSSVEEEEEEEEEEGLVGRRVLSAQSCAHPCLHLQQDTPSAGRRRTPKPPKPCQHLQRRTAAQIWVLRRGEKTHMCNQCNDLPASFDCSYINSRAT